MSFLYPILLSICVRFAIQGKYFRSLTKRRKILWLWSSFCLWWKEMSSTNISENAISLFPMIQRPFPSFSLLLFFVPVYSSVDTAKHFVLVLSFYPWISVCMHNALKHVSKKMPCSFASNCSSSDSRCLTCFSLCLAFSLLVSSGDRLFRPFLLLWSLLPVI